MTAPAHFGQYLANQELEWLPTDTKENYEKLNGIPFEITIDFNRKRNRYIGKD